MVAGRFPESNKQGVPMRIALVLGIIIGSVMVRGSTEELSDDEVMHRLREQGAKVETARAVLWYDRGRSRRRKCRTSRTWWRREFAISATSCA